MTASVTITNTSNRGETIHVAGTYGYGIRLAPGKSHRFSVLEGEGQKVNAEMWAEAPPYGVEHGPPPYEDWTVRAEK